MAGPEQHEAGTVAILGVLALIAACGGTTPEPRTTPLEDTASQATVEETEEVQGEPQRSPRESTTSPGETLQPAADSEAAPVEAEPTVAEAPDSEARSNDDASIVMIDSGSEAVDSATASLVEAARAERERRQIAPPAQIVITDKNLADYATGELTVAAGPQDTAAAGSQPTSSDADRMAQDETYWRNGAREIRLAWKEAAERVEELEGKVFDLRQRFYREDDGFYRDGQIKPAWDRAIDQLEAARLEVEERQQELEIFLERGRQAGAFPGWLREGIELEPVEEEEADNIAEPDEPVIYRNDGSQDPP